MSLFVKEIVVKQIRQSLSFDGVIPLSFLIIYNDNDNDILHYEVVTKYDSFFEIEIFKKNGKIKSIILMNINKKDAKETSLIDIKEKIKLSGLPIINTDTFKKTENYFDRFQREDFLEVEYDNKSIKIIINKIIPSKYIEMCNGCYLGLTAKGELSEFVITNLQNEQLLCFKDTFLG